MSTRAGARDQERDGWTVAVEAFAGDDPGRSVRVRRHGRVAAVADEVVRPGASVNKLFVAIAVALASTAPSPTDRVDLDETVAVEDLPPIVWPSVTLALAPDHRLTVAELAALMLATSDNRIADHLVARLGPDRITGLARSIGCTATEVAVGFADEHLGPRGRANVTTTRDCDTALTAIATEPTYRWLRPALRSSLYNTRILAGLDGDTVVSHKTGTLAGVVNDVGIVHAESGDLTVCFLTDGQADHARTSADIGRCVSRVVAAADELEPDLTSVPGRPGTTAIGLDPAGTTTDGAGAGTGTTTDGAGAGPGTADARARAR